MTVFSRWLRSPDLTPTEFLSNFQDAGGEAHSLFRAQKILKRMIQKREHSRINFQRHEPLTPSGSECKKTGYKILLGFTSNIISSGLRDHIALLVRNTAVDVIVTTAGGVEEDLIKCVGGDTLIGSFALPGKSLREQGLNRIGNLLISNENYVKFEKFLWPILDRCIVEKKVVTPSTMIARLGVAIQDPSSVWYWTARREIPVFCPAFTDGSIGDIIFFHSFRKPGLVLDVLRDVCLLNEEVCLSSGEGVGMILVGDGLVKDHLFRSCRMSCSPITELVLLTTDVSQRESINATSFNEDLRDCSMSPDIRAVLVHCEATITLPLLVSVMLEQLQNIRNSSELEKKKGQPQGL